MNAPSGAATQICSPQFDRRFFSLPAATQQYIQRKIDELGRNLPGFPHHRMQGVDAFRMRIGDFRVIYQFNVQKNELILIAVGNRRDVYKALSN
jgi:mRNA-degrading endonuclease RelE of RelBE toxin-antitoxin system